MPFAIHIDRKNMRGKPSSSYVFCWVCMRVTGATIWPVLRRTRVMLLPVGAGEHQWSDVECENCRTLYRIDPSAPLPRSEAHMPNAIALTQRVRAGELTDDDRVDLLVTMFGDFQYMLWTRANDGRVETITTLLSLVFIILLITSFGFWYSYADPRARSTQLLTICLALSAATIAMFIWIAMRANGRHRLGLQRGVLDRIALAANHLQPTQDVIEEALDQLARFNPNYANDLRRTGLVDRIMNPRDTLRS